MTLKQAKTEITRPAKWLAKLPAILHEAEGKPEYPKLCWAWHILASAAVAVGGLG